MMWSHERTPLPDLNDAQAQRRRVLLLQWRFCSTGWKQCVINNYNTTNGKLQATSPKYRLILLSSWEKRGVNIHTIFTRRFLLEFKTQSFPEWRCLNTERFSFSLSTLHVYRVHVSEQDSRRQVGTMISIMTMQQFGLISSFGITAACCQPPVGLDAFATQGNTVNVKWASNGDSWFVWAGQT